MGITPTQYAYAGPLGYWFYLIANGKGSIPSLGINKAVKIVLESLNLMSSFADIKEMMDATLAVVENEFGICSPEAYAVGRAWLEVCVGPADFTDCFTVEGYPIVCEEDNYMHMWIDNPTVGALYEWRFPAGWSVTGATGNLFIGENFFATAFPTYDWYPRSFNIKVSSILLGPKYTQYKYIRLLDCDNDDPSCAGANSERSIGRRKTYDNSISTDRIDFKQGGQITILRVHDLMGRLLYCGVPEEFDNNSLKQLGFVVFSYFDESGRLVKSKKSVVPKH
jgi:hypothetical protein